MAGQQGRVPPQGLAARALALDLLAGVLRDRLPLSELEAAPSMAEAAPEDRARAGRLCRTVLRNASRADAALRPFVQKPPPPAARDILRLATVELLGEDEAAHGVVNAAVTLARARVPRAAGMVNAVLRRVADAGPERWQQAPPQRLPDWLRGRLGAVYGNRRVAAMEAVFAASPPLDLTPRDATRAAVLAETLGGTVLPTGSIRLHPSGAVSRLPGFAEGHWWVQDAAAALAVHLLRVAPGERVLDLCAAPGGKTLQMVAAGAHVTALDLSEARLARVTENLTRTGLSADLVAADLLDWAPEGEGFDAVLLDAPCTATGTVRRHPDLPYVKDAKGLKALAATQAAMLDRAVALTRPGGRLVYCTCSLLPEEGEAQLAAVLQRHPDLVPDEVALDCPVLVTASLASASASAGTGAGTGAGADPGWRAGPGALRLTPDLWAQTGGLDGFFIAALRKMPVDP